MLISVTMLSTDLKRKFSHEKRQVPLPTSTSAQDLKYIDTLSGSTFADVVRVRRQDTNEVIVVKAFGRGSWRSEYLFSAELRVLQQVNSPWLVNFYGCIRDVEEDFLMMEYMPRGNFLQLLTKYQLTENQVKFYAGEMFLAVDSLHQAGIMHRNVQLSNFLIHSSGHLRISGFGLTYHFGENEEVAQPIKESTSSENKKRKKSKLRRITNPVFASADKAIPVAEAKTNGEDNKQHITESGTSYMAPEVLRLVMPKPYFQMIKRKLGYSYLCDYWSLGVAIYCMLYGYLPFTPDSKGLILDKVLNYRKTLVFPLSASTISAAGTDLVKALLKKESSRLGRMNGLEDVQHHHFFSDLCWNLLGHGNVSVPITASDLKHYIDFRQTAGLTDLLRKSDNKVKKSPSPLNLSKSDSSDESGNEQKMVKEVMGGMKPKFEMPLCSDPSVSFSGRGGADGSSGADIQEIPRPDVSGHASGGSSTMSQQHLPTAMIKGNSQSSYSDSKCSVNSESSSATLASIKGFRCPERAKEVEQSYLQKLITWFNPSASNFSRLSTHSSDESIHDSSAASG